jgi:ATP-dependent DNA helicase RecG
MKQKELMTLIAGGENERVEFKSAFGDAVIEALVAFANTSGGKVLVGVDDRGNIPGIMIGKETIPKWLNEIKQKTGYKIMPDVKILEINKKQVVELRITEYPSKPISYKGRYIKRFGNSNHIMTTDEIVNEYLRVRNRSWDMFIAENYTLEDLDLEAVFKLIQKINSKRENKIEEDPLLFLKKHGLIQDINITNAALLLFSRNKLDITELQIGLFETDTVIKKSITLKENLLDEVERVMDFIMTYITKEYVITGAPERDERWQYPLSAVREFLINAIIHRDYRKGIHSQFKVFRDKILFWNIGKLPEELTIEDLYKGTEKSIPRNIKVAEIFKEAFLIERYGSGIKRAVEELTDYKLPAPKIVETAGGIEIVIYGTPQEKKEHQKNGGINGGINGGLNGGLNILCEYIKNNPGKRINEISSILQIPESTLEKQAKKLKDLGKITYKGSKKKGGYYVTKKGTG